MDIHKNARLTPHSRAELVRRADFGVCVKTIGKWVARFEADGEHGLLDRSSRPKRSPRQTQARALARIETLRRQRQTGQQIAQEVGTRFEADGEHGLLDRSSRPKRSPRQTQARALARIETLRRQRQTGQQIAQEVGVSPATVSRVLRRLGLHRLDSLEPAEPVCRYERENPGELIHIDIKKLGRFNKVGHRITRDRSGQSNSRGVGWEFVHVCIDDASRLAFAEIMPDEKKESAIAFLKAARAYYRKLGIRVERVMTDNGSCYRSKAFQKACKAFGLRHIFTRPYTPKTNGKAERFIQTALREWAYAIAYENSQQRRIKHPIWLHRYNWHRPHASLKANPPISRLGLTMDNLLRFHI